ncbi:MAG: ROK family protein, partial [Chloroflexi bacterium]|nr:ROK family protein [Chloroflexota bacterium]
VQAATWGEWRLGAGEGFSDLVCLFVGTGIGGGLILDGKLYRGASGSAGELGHMVLYPGGRACMCGRRGCLEAYAGGWAIAARAREAVHGDKTAGRHLLTLAGGDAAAVTAALVSEAAHGGDALTKTLVRQVGDDLGLGVASVVNAFNPQRLVLGGGVIEGLPELAPVVREVVSRQALAPAAARVEVVKAGLGMYGGVIGAALIAHAAVPSESVS